MIRITPTRRLVDAIIAAKPTTPNGRFPVNTAGPYREAEITYGDARGPQVIVYRTELDHKHIQDQKKRAGKGDRNVPGPRLLVLKARERQLLGLQ